MCTVSLPGQIPCSLPGMPSEAYTGLEQPCSGKCASLVAWIAPESSINGWLGSQGKLARVTDLPASKLDYELCVELRHVCAQTADHNHHWTTTAPNNSLVTSHMPMTPTNQNSSATTRRMQREECEKGKQINREMVLTVESKALKTENK